MKNYKVIAGSLSRPIKDYTQCDLPQMVGQVVEAVASAKADSAYGTEPCTVLFFNNGTKHGFVHPKD